MQAGTETLNAEPQSAAADRRRRGLRRQPARSSTTRARCGRCSPRSTFRSSKVARSATSAVRYDHYSDFGSTTNPKVSLRWQPMPSLLFRGSWGTGFLAPTLYQLWNPTAPGLSQAGVSDPLRCPDPNGRATRRTDCNTQYTTTFGGNPNLEPETANQTMIGGVWEPVTGVSLGADWFYLDLKNLVEQRRADRDDPRPGDLPTVRLPRDARPVQPTCPGGRRARSPRSTSASSTWAATKIQGIDVDAQVQARRRPSTAASSSTLTGTYYISYDVAAAGRQLRRLRVERLPGGRHRHHPALEELRGAHLELRPVERRRSATRTRARTSTCRPTTTATCAASAA